MTTENLSIPSKADGLALSALLYTPDTAPKGIVQIAHGMAEHKARYIPFLEALAEAGYAALINDHRGHGDSVATTDDLGHFDADALLCDMRQLTDYLTKRFPGIPLCLFGHSMGSLAARAYARTDDGSLNALILCGSPSEISAAGAGLMLNRAMRAFKGARHRSKFFDNLTNANMRKGLPADGSQLAWLSSDEAEVAKYEQDDKCGFVFTLNGYRALLTLMKDAYAKDGWALKRADMPILFISGADDPCMISMAAFEAAAERMRQVGYKDVITRTYPGMRHEILLEPDRRQVFDDVVQFVSRAFARKEH